MANWGILFVVTVFALIATLFGVFILALDHLSDDMCATTIFDQVPSPDSKNQAILFEIYCDATTGFNGQVLIVASDFDLKKKNPQFPTSFFSANGNPSIRVTWLNADRLEVQYPEGTNPSRIEPRYNGIQINYTKTS